MASTAALVDAGFFASLFARSDKHPKPTRKFLAGAGNVQLHSIWPVVAEACCFLDTNDKSAFLMLILFRAHLYSTARPSIT